jgi:hypothetical protein
MKSPRRFDHVPPPREVLTLRVLAGERQARACELVAVSRGRIPRDQAWVLLRRLLKRKAIRVARRVAAVNGGPPHPVYSLTDYGKRVIKAMDLLEGRGRKTP